MPPSNSFIKSYTQPSCTLEILDRGSPEDLHPGNTNSSQLQFGLRLTDSLHGEERQIEIRGDRNQLAELHEAVTTYVQTLLGSSPDRFNALLSSQPNLNSEAVDSSAPTGGNSGYPRMSEDTKIQDETYIPSREINLQPGSELSHKLFLGDLATPETGQAIDLTVLQLFDLATVLDDYSADVLTTPAIVRPRKASTPTSTWASIAAMLLLGVGLTAAVVQLLNNSDENQPPAQNAAVPRSNNNPQSIALSPSPSPQLSSPDPKSPYNLPSPNLAAGKLSSPDALPSLPPVGTSNPLATASPSSGIPSPTTFSSTQLPTVQSNPSVPSPPPIPTTKITPVSPIPGITQVSPVPKQGIPQQPGSIPIPKQSDVTAIAGINSTANIPRPPAQASSSDIVSSKQAGSATEIPSNEPTARQKIKAALKGQSEDSLTLGDPTTSSQPSESKIAFANTPQLAEVKDYFVKHWEPPTGLTQTLEYSIVLDVDGSIQRIEPLGKAARIYVDRSSMPLIGEPFVSANPQGTTPRVRVVLSPDGKVQTFAEPD